MRVSPRFLKPRGWGANDAIVTLASPRSLLHHLYPSPSVKNLVETSYIRSPTLTYTCMISKSQLVFISIIILRSESHVLPAPWGKIRVKNGTSGRYMDAVASLFYH